MATKHYWSLLFDGSCDYHMPNPGNNSIAMGESSTTKVLSLVDGSKAFITPQVKNVKDAFNWEITEASARDEAIPVFRLVDGSTIFSDYSMLNYLKNNVKRLTLTTHTNYSVNGYITRVERQFTLSGIPQKYIIRVDFIPED
jgi:hypothetical protein